ncbi:MAG: signal peptidase I [Chloroflexi bacterium]|nr:signal peptidase I [Chloroflexota bacterium]
MSDDKLPAHLRDDVLDLLKRTERPQTITIVGASMLPLLRAGDRVIVEPRQQIQPGAIVVFQQGDQLIAHRVLRIEDRAGQVVLTTKGDATWHLDPPVRADAILGCAVAIERGARVLSLDTRAARVIGAWAVAHARVSAPIYAGLLQLKIKTLGRGSNRVTRGLKNALNIFFDLPHRIQSAGWKERH